MTENVTRKLAELPKEPGVYFYKDENKKIIYIGKASILNNRVRQYFQSNKNHDQKTKLLVADIADIDWVTTKSEIDALFLEAEMIKRYMPKYNIALRDDRHWSYVKIDIKSDFPTVTMVRRPLDDNAEYFGPFTESYSVRQALKTLRKVFPYHTKKTSDKRVSLDYHLGLSPGLEEGKTSIDEYRADLHRVMQYLRGNYKKLIVELEKDMRVASKEHNFELAAKRRDQVRQLNSLQRRKIFGKAELFDISKDQALAGLQETLGLKGVPRRIETYDISHISGTNNVASMVVFTDGVANKGAYRKFKMHQSGNDDFAHMKEVISRRFSKQNLMRWPKPDLVVIDGGKGQVGAVRKVLLENNIDVPMVGIAKRLEQIIVPLDGGGFEVKNIPLDSHIIKLVQRMRDEAHRFAVTYHSLLRGKQQTASLLDSVPGIGLATRKKLIKHFGSYKGVIESEDKELLDVISKRQVDALRESLK